jgi:uncharacterized protein YabN with tetrapyrrole methylase and pyrophosphatase domain
VALAFPAIMRVEKLGKLAAKERFEWQKIEPFFNKINEEILELRSELAEKEFLKSWLKKNYVISY